MFPFHTDDTQSSSFNEIKKQITKLLENGSSESISHQTLNVTEMRFQYFVQTVHLCKNKDDDGERLVFSCNKSIKTFNLNYLWIQVAALLHQGADGKPKTIRNRKLIFDDVIVNVTRMRIVPFRETGHNVNG